MKKDQVSPTENNRKLRIRLVLGAIFFVIIFQWVYATYLNPVWGYIGFAYNAPSLPYLFLGCGLAVLPSVWLPIGITRPSQLVYWVLYVTVYVPSILVALYASLLSANEVAQLMLALFAGFSVMGLSYLRPLLKIRPLVAGSGLIFWYAMTAIGAGLIGWVFFVYWGHLQLVSFAAVYEELRFAADDVAAGTGVGYATMALSGAILPFFMAWGLYHKRWAAFILGAAAELMLYTASGSKGTLLAIILVPGIYFYLRVSTARFGLRLIWTTVILMVVLNIPNLLTDRPSDLLFTASSVGLVRTLSIQGLATSQYQKFFSNHPYTYYSHVKGINLLKEYPYQRSLGEEVGFEFYNSNTVDWNANLWSSDGIAALGLPGIILISAICALLFWVLDSAAAGHDPGFAALVCCYGAINMGNSSLFTSVLSGGLGFLVLLFFVMPREGHNVKVRWNKKALLKPALVKAVTATQAKPLAP